MSCQIRLAYHMYFLNKKCPDSLSQFRIFQLSYQISLVFRSLTFVRVQENCPFRFVFSFHNSVLSRFSRHVIGLFQQYVRIVRAACQILFVKTSRKWEVIITFSNHQDFGSVQCFKGDVTTVMRFLQLLTACPNQEYHHSSIPS